MPSRAQHGAAGREVDVELGQVARDHGLGVQGDPELAAELGVDPGEVLALQGLDLVLVGSVSQAVDDVGQSNSSLS